MDIHDKRHSGARNPILLERVLDWVPVGVIVLSWDLELLLVNRQGREHSRRWCDAISGRGILPELPRDLLHECEELRKCWRKGKECRRPPLARRLGRGLNQALRADILLQPGVIEGAPPFFLLLLTNVMAPLRQPTQALRQKEILSQISPAERAVAILALQGLTNREIARRLRRQRCTIKDHLSHIYGKLCVKNRVQLAALLSRDLMELDARGEL
jgi:DNA-binding CsgD family transcriptional regulator